MTGLTEIELIKMQLISFSHIDIGLRLSNNNFFLVSKTYLVYFFLNDPNITQLLLLASNFPVTINYQN